jgi:heptosyltransferase-3
MDIFQEKANLKRILVFRIGHLGDTVVALPAFWTLRKSFPTAYIALLTNYDASNPSYISPRSVLPDEGLFDSWISYPSRKSKASGIADSVRLLLTIRRMGFDSTFYMMTRNRTLGQIDRDVRFFRMAGIKNILGINHLKSNLLPIPIPIPTPQVRSEADFLLDILKSEGIEVSDDIVCDLALTGAERGFINTWLQDASTDQPLLLAVAPGSKWESKVWPEARFLDVVSKLIGEFGVFPIVLGGSEDRDKGDRLVGSWKTGTNAAGQLTVRQSAALLEKCVLYLGNDTGTMHLAGAVGTPIVAIFAALDWIGRWVPFGENNRLFRERVECEGCHSPACFNDHKCLDLVSTERVYKASRELILSRVSSLATM